MRQPQALMIFAAGFGTRMGALTADRPKPLVKVAGRALIDHALDVARAAKARPVVVNLHYLGDQLAAHLAPHDVALNWERDVILETGGGLRAALPLLGDGPVATLNSDAVWTGANPITQLHAAWDDMRMDALLLLAPVGAALGHGARPDFAMDAAGHIQPHAGSTQPGYVYLGAQIVRTDRLAAIPEASFSIWRIWDQAFAEGRAFGLIHQGGWCDVGRPEGIATAEALLSGAANV